MHHFGFKIASIIGYVFQVWEPNYGQNEADFGKNFKQCDYLRVVMKGYIASPSSQPGFKLHPPPAPQGAHMEGYANLKVFPLAQRPRYDVQMGRAQRAKMWEKKSILAGLKL